MGSPGDDDGNEKMVPCLVGVGFIYIIYIYIYIYTIYLFSGGDLELRFADGAITFALFILYFHGERVVSAVTTHGCVTDAK